MLRHAPSTGTEVEACSQNPGVEFEIAVGVGSFLQAPMHVAIAGPGDGEDKADGAALPWCIAMESGVLMTAAGKPQTLHELKLLPYADQRQAEVHELRV